IPLQIELLYVIVLCRTSLSHDRKELFPRIEAVMQEARRLGLPAAAAIGSQLIAILHEEHHSFGSAGDAAMQSLEWSRGVDPATEMLAVSNTARCLLQIQRDVDRAEALVRDAQALSTRANVEHTELPLALGFLHAHRGEYDRGIYFLERALDLAGREQDHWREWLSMSRLVTIALEQGDPATALLYCQRLDPITAKMSGGSEGPRAEALHALAQMLAGERENLDAALELLRTIDSKGDLAFALNFVARQNVDRGDTGAAESAALEALAAAQEVDRPSDAALARVTLAELEARRGGDANARAILEPALDSSRWADLTLRAQQAVLRCASFLNIPTTKEKPHGDHGSRTVV
ncbi:MAG: tetratricopeptide repeat protein, partial [Thermoanaerobaculia bacterium]